MRYLIPILLALGCTKSRLPNPTIETPDFSEYIALYTSETQYGAPVEHTHSFELADEYADQLGGVNNTLVYGGNDTLLTDHLIRYFGLAASQELPEPTYPTEIIPMFQYSNAIEFTTPDGQFGFLWATWQDEDVNDWTLVKSFRLQYGGKHVRFCRNQN